MVEWSLVEAVGYVASALVVASLAMTSVVRLRTLSLVGSHVFVVYGLLIGSLAIVAANLVTMLLTLAIVAMKLRFG